MKRRDLEVELTRRGYVLVRQTGPHDVWKKGGSGKGVYVPRHREVNENTARQILRDAT